MPGMRRFALLAGSVAVAVALGTFAPASAMAGVPLSGGPAESITFLLTPRDPAQVAALARDQRASRAQRTAKLAALLPGSARRSAVADALRSRGLRVTASTPWSVTARGPAAQVHALTAGTTMASGGAAPRVAEAPWRRIAGLQGQVSAAVTDTGGPVAHPVIARSSVGAARFTPSVIDGPGARTLYSAPLAPASRSTGLTVATLQLSGWDATDLTHYAGSHGIADPVGAGRYEAVSVDGADPAVPDGTDGDLEVALDQEALLAVAPAAHQRAYFAPNTSLGFVDGLEQVATDALDPDHHLTALSISWGACEQDWDPQTIAAIDTAVSNVVAAGVTVFAASGDDGAYDCQGSSVASVDFPASDPQVVGVGGTTADVPARTEVAWPGSGGGSSRVFTRPDYQTLFAPTATARQVPDLAAAADPDSGLNVYWNGMSGRVGGTSLASPLSAALLTGVLALRGQDQPLGNILTGLYAAPAAAFRGVSATAGGHPPVSGYDNRTGRGAPLWSRLLSSLGGTPLLTMPAISHSRRVPVQLTLPAAQYLQWQAGTGDEPASCAAAWAAGTTATPPVAVQASRDGDVTAWLLGRTVAGACQHADATVTVDTAAPKPALSAARTAPRAATVIVRWAASDPSPGTGIGSYTVKILRTGWRTPVWTKTTASAGSYLLRTVHGPTFTAVVTARDRAGNTTTLTRKLPS